MQSIEEQLKTRLPSGRAFLEELAKHPDLAGKVVIMEDPRYVSEGDMRQALAVFNSVCEGNLAAQEHLDGALSTMVQGLIVALNFRTIPPEKQPRFPSIGEAKLVEGLEIFAAAKRHPQAKVLLSATTFDGDLGLAQSRRIQIVCGAFTALTKFFQLLQVNCAADQAAAYQHLKEGYDLIRSVAVAHPLLSDLLAKLEEILYGQAQQAQTTKRENEARLEKLTQKAEDRGIASAEKKVRTQVGQQIRALFQDIERIAPESAGQGGPGDPAQPAQGDPRSRPR